MALSLFQLQFVQVPARPYEAVGGSARIRRSQVTMEWQYTRGNLDMKEAGEEYKALVEFPVKVKEVD
ncbi:MAG: hypothetical protein IPH05_06955 [Flavobacteriales bacterium]|nr:hypothetical protein [Flavobacteriales bacterium]